MSSGSRCSPSLRSEVPPPPQAGPPGPSVRLPAYLLDDLVNPAGHREARTPPSSSRGSHTHHVIARPAGPWRSNATRHTPPGLPRRLRLLAMTMRGRIATSAPPPRNDTPLPLESCILNPHPTSSRGPHTHPVIARPAGPWRSNATRHTPPWIATSASPPRNDTPLAS